MRRNRVWIAVVVCFILSFANLLYAQNATSTGSSDALMDVLKTLQSKGVLTQAEYDSLKQRVAEDAQRQAAPQLKTAAMESEDAKAMNVVSAMDNGVGFHTGRFDVAFSGEVNGFYMHSRPDHALANYAAANDLSSACDLCLIDQSPDSTSSVRSGLLPSDLSIKISTQERGWDVGVFFGIWPAIQNSNIAGIETGLTGTTASGTPGIDFRQNFATLGHAHFGTLKIGRDLGLFGQEAILNDMTLLGAGSTNGNNITPANVTFGRIGVGYIYTDFLPQITYTTPSFSGLQAAFGIMQAYDDPFAGSEFGLTGHTQPMMQGKLTYTMKPYHHTSLKLWSNFVTQKETALFPAGTLSVGNGIQATGWDYGFNASYHGLSVVGYGYNGWGLGIAGLLFDGIGVNSNVTRPNARPSQGWYGQVGYTYHKNFFGFSDGQSNLSPGSYADQLFMGPAVVRNNTAYVFQYRFAVTKWDNLVAEYTHATSENNARIKGNSDSIALGTIVFF